MRIDDLKLADGLFHAGDLDLSHDIIKRLLRENPNDPAALGGASRIFQKADNIPVAYHLAKRLTELQPERADAWVHLGWMADQLWQNDEAEKCYRMGLKRAKTDAEKAAALCSLAGLFIHMGEFERAEPVANAAVECDPFMRKARANLGFAQLGQRKWEGWENYHYSLGTEARKKIQYVNEPEWDGTKGLNVAIYGEQGLGDEISFASMIPDAVRDCEHVVIDCDARLAGLFARSFPSSAVYGTRKESRPAWHEEDRNIQASIAMGALGGLYRTTDEAFPGTPYLVADQDRVTMWKALWAQKRKPVIGIAWTGGTYANGSTFRSWSLEDLLLLLRCVDAHWVCLQYKDASEEISAFKAKYPDVDLVQYPWATLTDDYDDTAGIVASLDRIVSMQTAVVHLAGALGVKCDVFVPKTSQWRYGENYTSLPWYKSVNVIRQAVRGHWSNTLHDYSVKLYHEHKAA